MTEFASAGSPPLLRARAYIRLREFVLRHPVLSVALVAFAVRMVVAISMAVLGLSDPVQDDEVYIAIVRAKVDGSLGSLDTYFQDLYSSVWAFTTPLSLVGTVFGVHVLGGQVVVALWAALTAAATTAIALRLVSSRRLALFAGLIPALLPSQILWSSVWLKDAAVSACLAVTVLGVVIAMQASARRTRSAGLAIAAAGLVGLSGLRLNSFVLACWCVAIVVGVVYRKRPAILLTTVVLLAIGPWLGNAGVLGSKAASLSDELGSKRAAGAVNADSALVPVPPTLPPNPANPRPPVNDIVGNLRYLPEGLLAALVRPLPWEASTSRSSTFAKLDNLLWYPILALAVCGLWKGRRRREVLLVALLVAGTVGVYALAEGNLGTAFRHRGEVVWATGLLFCVFVDGRIRRRRAHVDSADHGPVDAVDHGRPGDTNPSESSGPSRRELTPRFWVASPAARSDAA